MPIAFVKMQALGNDFVLIDETKHSFPLSLSMRQRLADRHYGIGCDQLLTIEKSDDPRALYQYRVFNADGFEVEQCGNGARCIARYLLDEGKVRDSNFSLLCKAGLVQIKQSDNAEIAVNMGVPAGLEENPISFFREDESQEITFYSISMGNPHAVILTDKIEETVLDEMGVYLNDKTLSPFQQGVNVGFMRILTPRHIELAVYERGVGRTLACGSGACAAVAAGQRAGLLEEDVQVNLPGGNVRVFSEGQSLWLQGEANYVFRGEMFIG
ncbi:MAG: diaminopimelate epimerase [Gammaproteobacteria bacterium]|jgi:diaminopimelate epimerase|nr:diaminopimelate epimerase [Gammaproteobacteria bacterium]